MKSVKNSASEGLAPRWKRELLVAELALEHRDGRCRIALPALGDRDLTFGIARSTMPCDV